LKRKAISLLKSRNGVKTLNIPLNYKSSYYVYGHYLDNGKLFYVGKGIRGRKDNTFGRSKEWKLFTDVNSWCSEIIVDGLTESEALLKENEIINSVPDLLNIRLNSFELDLKDLENTFYYDSTSPSCLRWKVWNNQKNESKRLPNDVAGTLSHTKYNIVQGYKVGFNNKEYTDLKDRCVTIELEKVNEVANLFEIKSFRNIRERKLKEVEKGVYVDEDFLFYVSYYVGKEIKTLSFNVYSTALSFSKKIGLKRVLLDLEIREYIKNPKFRINGED